MLLCAIGIPIGLFIGYFSGVTLFPAIISQTTLGTESTSISISPLIFVISILFSLLTVLMSCLRPGFIASKISRCKSLPDGIYKSWQKQATHFPCCHIPFTLRSASKYIIFLCKWNWYEQICFTACMLWFHYKYKKLFPMWNWRWTLYLRQGYSQYHCKYR